METITQIVNQFLHNVDALIQTEAHNRATRAVEAAFGNHAALPMKITTMSKRSTPEPALAVRPKKLSRRKGPIQLCPSPGCKERAAPVFGMVCKKHKSASKTQIKKWREARRVKAKK